MDIASTQAVGKQKLIDSTDIQFLNDYRAINNPRYAHTIKRIYCMKGNVRFTFAGRQYDFAEGDSMLLLSHQTIDYLQRSDDFQISAMFYSDRMMRMMMPTPEYGTQILLAQMQNPVLHMSSEEFNRCLSLEALLKERFHMTGHTFYFDVLKHIVQVIILEHYDIVARSKMHHIKRKGVSYQKFHKFIAMLHEGRYMEHRDVAYYANELFITPKYLSELCTKASDRPASYWIDFFVTVELAYLFQDNSLSVADIMEKMHFTSISHFSHYVKIHFHMSPQEYRRRYTFSE